MTAPAPLPAGVVAFLDAHIFSVSQLETLLLLHEAAGVTRTAEDLSRETHMPARSIAPWLDAFVERGLLEAVDDGYRFAPRDDALRTTVDEVADCYARRRVSLSRHVYASREDPARRFADAFRFRRDKER